MLPFVRKLLSSTLPFDEFYVIFEHLLIVDMALSEVKELKDQINSGRESKTLSSIDNFFKVQLRDQKEKKIGERYQVIIHFRAHEE